MYEMFAPSRFKYGGFLYICMCLSDRAQMSKTTFAVKHFSFGGRESLETAVMANG